MRRCFLYKMNMAGSAKSPIAMTLTTINNFSSNSLCTNEEDIGINDCRRLHVRALLCNLSVLLFCQNLVSFHSFYYFCCRCSALLGQRLTNSDTWNNCNWEEECWSFFFCAEWVWQDFEGVFECNFPHSWAVHKKNQGKQPLWMRLQCTPKDSCDAQEWSKVWQFHRKLNYGCDAH